MLDLFAGSGAMGIEALSRGAAHATFVDRDRAAAGAIEANLRSCGFVELAEVVVLPAERFTADAAGTWDLALIDPPYAWGADDWLDLLDGLPSDLAVMESAREVEPPFGWEVIRSKRYGSSHVVVAQRRPV